MTFETDASTTGWGALCQGIRTEGPCSQAKQQMHINCLELLAAALAVKCFAKDKNILIHLRMDDTTALNYINKLGGTVSPDLNHLTKNLWTWCLERGITLQATHLAATLNVTADKVTPAWRAQPWYSILLEMLVHKPILLYTQQARPDIMRLTESIAQT